MHYEASARSGKHQEPSKQHHSAVPLAVVLDSIIEILQKAGGLMTVTKDKAYQEFDPSHGLSSDRNIFLLLHTLLQKIIVNI